VALLEIRLYPDPVLRVKCPEVETFDAALEKLAADMVETMYAAPGVGLAAPQVGVELRLAVVDVAGEDGEGDPQVLVNPRILVATGRETDVEGCLSIPGISEKVARAEHVRVEARDVAGNLRTIDAGGLLARAIQHEIDHLDGILFTDRLTGLRRERVRRWLKKARAESGRTPS
jgi:peptide deformylase